jgi:MFS family permease
VVLAAVAGCSALAALLAFASPRSLAQHVVDEKLPHAVGGPEAPPPAPFGWHTIRAGFTALRSSRVALATTLLGVGSMFAIGPLQAVVLPTFFARQAAPQLLGAALATVAVGLIAGSLLSAPLASRAGRRTVLVVALVASLAGLVAFAVAPSAGVALGAAIAVGLGFGLLAPVLPVLVTEHVPEVARARVFGLQNAGYLAAYPLGALLIGVVVQAADVRVGAIVCAALWAVLVAFGLAAPALRSLEPGAAPRVGEPPRA